MPRRLVPRPVGAALLTLALTVVPGPAQASPARPRPETSTEVRAEATRTARTVTELAAEYSRREQAAAAAAADLAVAFGAGGQAQATHDTLDGALRRARERQANHVRLLYTGAPDAITLAVLDAEDPAEALWRMSVVPRVGGDLVRGAAEDIRRTQRAMTDATAALAAADREQERLAQALRRSREEREAAELLLQSARARLADLTASARRLAAVEKAQAALDAARRAAEQRTLPDSGPITALGIPAGYLAAYRAAADTCPGLRWTLLAAVGQVESGHGRNNGPSSAGAVGPMQFMPATFARYGVDGDGDGKADPWNYRDAIPTAARYLCAGGLDATSDGVRRALFAYNHAQWYVDLVLRTEAAIVARYAATEATGHT